MTTAQFAEKTVHATLSTTTADPVTFWGSGHSLAVTNEDAAQRLWFRVTPTNEIQTITLSSWDAGDTIKFTIDGTESAALTMVASSNHADDIRRLLETLPTIGVGNVLVKQTSATVYVVYFINGCGHKDMSPITCTNGTGSATGVVAETLKGGSTVAVASGAGTYVVMPGQTKVLNVNASPKLNVSVVGSGNNYSVEVL